MNTDKVLEFYKHALSANKIDEKILLDAKNISSEVELKSFIQEKLLPVVKELGYDITEDDLLAYEKEASKQFSEEDLENITGGVSLKAFALGGLLSIATLAGVASFNSPASAMFNPSSYGMQSTSASVEDANTRYVQGQGTLRCTQNPSTRMWNLSLAREGSADLESVNFYANPSFRVGKFLDDAKTALSNYGSGFRLNTFTNRKMFCKETAIQGNTVKSTVGTITVTPGSAAQSYSLNFQRIDGSVENVNFASKGASFDTKRFLADAAIALQLYPESTAKAFVTGNSAVYLVSQEDTQPAAPTADTASAQVYTESTRESQSSTSSSQTKSLEDLKKEREEFLAKTRDDFTKNDYVGIAFGFSFGVSPTANDFVRFPNQTIAFTVLENNPRAAQVNPDGSVTVWDLDSGASETFSDGNIDLRIIEYQEPYVHLKTINKFTNLAKTADTASAQVHTESSSQTKSLEEYKREREDVLNPVLFYGKGINPNIEISSNSFFSLYDNPVAYTVSEDSVPRAAWINDDDSVTVLDLETGRSTTFAKGTVDLKIYNYGKDESGFSYAIKPIWESIDDTDF